jgi:hypothetical protein
MHWIYVGIMIWIGLVIAPYVIVFVIAAIPFVIGGLIGSFTLMALTHEPGWVFLGFIAGGIAPYILMDR